MQALSSQGVTVHSFDDFRQLGAKQPAEPVACQPSDICTIMYTSGTTGAPKVQPCLCSRFLLCPRVSACSTGFCHVCLFGALW